MNRRAVVAIALAPLILGGCATVAIPARVQLSPAGDAHPGLTIVDRRTDRQRAYREETSGATYKYFADDTFRPALVDVVRSRLGSMLEPGAMGVHVELLRADVGYFIASGNVVDAGPYGSRTAVGVLSAGIFNRAAAVESGAAFFTVRVDGNEVTGSAMQPIAEGRTPEDAVRQAADRALSQLASLFRFARAPAGAK
jgi:hypothetical protein